MNKLFNLNATVKSDRQEEVAK
ncbi:unnamed protein product, partial [Rotaria magnacalcarata]